MLTSSIKYSGPVYFKGRTLNNSRIPALNLTPHHQSSSIFRYNEQEVCNHRYHFIRALQKGASYDYRRFGTE